MTWMKMTQRKSIGGKHLSDQLNHHNLLTKLPSQERVAVAHRTLRKARHWLLGFLLKLMKCIFLCDHGLID